MRETRNFRPLVAAGVMLGIGFGGAIDGIALHQILQLHSMISNRIPINTLEGIHANMFWDGWFHAFTLLFMLTGLIMLWRVTARVDVPRSGLGLIGTCILGWGVFNIAEGIFNHHILELHHVVQALENPERFLVDLAFLAISVVLIWAGRTIINFAKNRDEQTTWWGKPGIKESEVIIHKAA